MSGQFRIPPGSPGFVKALLRERLAPDVQILRVGQSFVLRFRSCVVVKDQKVRTSEDSVNQFSKNFSVDILGT
jgi:hypothetical protein